MPGRLPLLAYALRVTWQRRDRDLLTVAGYQAAGGISGAIAKSAEQVYTGSTPGSGPPGRYSWPWYGWATGRARGTASTPGAG